MAITASVQHFLQELEEEASPLKSSMASSSLPGIYPGTPTPPWEGAAEQSTAFACTWSKVKPGLQQIPAAMGLFW